MSEAGNDNTAATTFSEREMQMLAWAMQSLKSGAPEIDYDKLAHFAGMSNPRSASNAWAKIKGKLALTTPEGGAVTTPKKGGAKKKAAAKGDSADGEGADGESPTKKTPRKRVAKKQEVDGEASPSPRKKGRAAKGQKGSDDETAADVQKEVKTEPDAEDMEPNGDSKMMGDIAAAEAEAEI